MAWKRVIRGEIEPAKAESIVSELLGVPMDMEPAVELVAAAMKIALQTRRSVYDAIYLALAIASGSPLVTGDRKLFEVINVGPFAAQIVWIGDLA